MLDDALTVDQHIRYFQAAYQIAAADRAEELIQRLGYTAPGHQTAGTLSGGTGRNSTSPSPSCTNPQVLLLDEPYQGFDWETYLAFWDLAADLRAAGSAILVITHLVFDQQRFDRVWHLAGGRIADGEARHASAA